MQKILWKATASVGTLALIIFILSAMLSTVAAAPKGTNSITTETLKGADFAIYTGSGTWNESIKAFESVLRWKGLTYEEIGPRDINTKNLTALYKGIFMPGGWAAYYLKWINSEGEQHIRDLIGNGGAYIGASAGAYYASDKVVWEGKEYDYRLDLFKGKTVGPIKEIAPWPDYTMTVMSMDRSHPANTYEPAERAVLYYGEPYFEPFAGQEMLVIARWNVPQNPTADKTPGIITFNYGKGRVALYGPHPEVEEDSSRDGSDWGDELSDGPDGSDWNNLWAVLDWLMFKPISRSPDIDDMPPVINWVNDFPDPLVPEAALTITANVTDNRNVARAWVSIQTANYNMSFDGGKAADLLSDGFETGSFSSSWKVYGPGKPWTVSMLQPYQGTYHARALQTGAGNPSYLEVQVSALGYKGIEVQYYRKLVGLDSTDKFASEWYDGSSYKALESKSSVNDQSYAYRSFLLPDSANNNPNLKLRFKCETGAVSEWCDLDNVKVTGKEQGSGLWEYAYDTTGLASSTYNYTVYAADSNSNQATPQHGSFTIS